MRVWKTEEVLEEIMAENFKLDKNHKLIDQRSSKNPTNKKHGKKHTTKPNNK